MRQSGMNYFEPAIWPADIVRDGIRLLASVDIPGDARNADEREIEARQEVLLQLLLQPAAGQA